MNVIVSNRQKEIIDNANIDAIKDLNGLFNVDDLISKFKNYFFTKMVLDATSVINFASKEVLEKLVNEIGAEKLVILLPESPEPPMEFKKLLIDLKIYNFTNKIDDVIRFVEKSNTYEDAIKTLDNGFNSDLYVDSSIKEGNETNDQIEESFVEENQPGQTLGSMLNNFSVQSTDDVVDEQEEINNENVVEESNEVSSEESIDNDNIQTEEERHVEENKEPEEYHDDKIQNTFLISDSLDDNVYEKPEIKKTIIGVKNVTLHAGSTSLIYMMHKVAVSELKKDVLSVEIDKNDFKYFRNNKMVSVDSKNIDEIINSAKEELIFVDLNEYSDTDFCTDVIYLVEPSTIKLNKLMVENKNTFKELKDKKVVLNKSLLSSNDIRTLTSEADMEFFDNIEPLNDRIFNEKIVNLLEQLNVK